ncbi:4912_t:CDS:2 [Acaulospora morrowiae]|uniref:4912_t:CDS:1 n=1 Tax=Acaulospora morrowiae TaxID=94023 RepID=A0A9N9FB39_9GLOM|nr:4912_t:CDS:2 [Acaulospora morrowiae]
MFQLTRSPYVKKIHSNLFLSYKRLHNEAKLLKHTQKVPKVAAKINSNLNEGHVSNLKKETIGLPKASNKKLGSRQELSKTRKTKPTSVKDSLEIKSTSKSPKNVANKQKIVNEQKAKNTRVAAIIPDPTKEVTVNPSTIVAIPNPVDANIKETEISSADIENPVSSITYLEVGDFAELRRNGKSYSGIVTKTRSDPTSMGKNHILLPNGFIIPYRNDDVVFYIRGYAYTQKLNDSILPPGSPIPSNYGKIAGDLSKSAAILLQSRILEFRQAYSHFASSDETEMKTVNINDLACHIFKTKQPQNSQVLATIMYVLKENTYFMTDPNKLRESGRFQLRAKADVNAITKVLEWIRTRDTKCTEFQSKAQAIINYKRSITENKNNLDISSTRIESLPEFTEADKLFIHFFKSYVVNSSSFDASISAMLKPMKLYDTDLDKECAIRFLKDIGVWTPWENLNAYEPSIMLNGHGVSRTADSDYEESVKLAESLMSTNPFIYKQKYTFPEESPSSLTSSMRQILVKASSNLGPKDFYQHDICEDIRHDFGDLPVYTIDDHTAHELDDGISIEYVDANKFEPSSTWVHVHVADPSTYIHPTHRLSQIARSRVQSVYFPERHYAMLPSIMSEKRFSLGVNSESNGNSVMSFSFRIGGDGNLLDYSVRPGIVRNVKTLFYDDVDTILSWENIGGTKEEIDFFQKQLHYHPQLIPVPKNVHRELPPSSKEDLNMLQKISFLHAKNRINSGAISMGTPQPSIQLSPFPLPAANPDPQGPILYSGMPTIQVGLDKSMHSPARAMIAEYMILAGVVAAKFCQERNIPILYRKQEIPNSPILEEGMKFKDMRNGIIPVTSIVKMRPMMTPAELSTEFGPHWAMGILGGYVKVTSPLRRYGDILAHWQMKADLLGLKFPFSKEELTNMAKHIRSREREISRTQTRSEKFWILNLFNRMIEAGTLPELTGIIVDILEKGEKTVILKEFGILGKFSGTTDGQVGDVLNVKPTLVQPNKVHLCLGPA